MSLLSINEQIEIFVSTGHTMIVQVYMYLGRHRAMTLLMAFFIVGRSK